MNVIYLRHGTAKARKFINKKLRGGEEASIYDIEAGDCCLAPLPRKRNGYVLTFLNDMSREMLAFLYHSGMCIQRNQN